MEPIKWTAGRPFVVYGAPDGGHRVEYLDNCREGRVYDAWFGNNYVEAKLCAEALDNLERRLRPATRCDDDEVFCAAMRARPYFVVRRFAKRFFIRDTCVVLRRSDLPARENPGQTLSPTPVPEPKRPETKPGEIRCPESADVRCG